MKRKTKYKLMTGILAGTIFISGWKFAPVQAETNLNKIESPLDESQSTELLQEIEQTPTEETQPKELVEYTEPLIEEFETPTLEEFLNSLEDKQVKKFYTKLYELYDYERFNTRSEIPQYFQTIYGNKFSCGTIQSAGCGISSLSMVSSYLFDEIITPDMMTIYDNSPSPASAFEKGIKRLNLNCEIYRGQAAIDNLDLALDAGHPVIALMGRASIFTDTGHFIVIAGKTSDGKYIVNDPNLENLYKPNLIEGFTNGFSKQEVTRGMKGVYIFDKKEQFKDQRDKKLNFKMTQPSSEESHQIDDNSFVHLKYNDIVLTKNNIGLKSSPTITSYNLQMLNPDTELEVIATVDNEWLAVVYNNQIGYVQNNQVISLLEKAQDLYPELDLTELKPVKIVYLSTDINLRCGNSIEFDAISILRKFETVRVLGEYKDWYFVITNEYNFGFIPQKYTKEITDKCIVVDKSEQQIYYYNEGEKIYTSPTKIYSDKNGMYNILTKTRNIVIIDPEANWQPTYSQDGLVFSETEKGTKVLIHR